MIRLCLGCEPKARMSGDFEYVPDEHGHRILVDLAPSETVEFEQLEKLRRDSSTGLALISAEGTFSRAGEKDGSISSKNTNWHGRL